MTDMTLRRVLRLWLWWALVSGLMFAYSAPLLIFNTLTSSSIELIPGNRVVLTPFRLFDDRLNLGLIFNLTPPNGKHPELGDWTEDKDGRLALGEGADVQFRVEVDGNPAVMLEALPKSSANERDMTPTLAVDRVWSSARAALWSPRPELRRGRNEVIIEVATVEAPLVGQHVEVFVWPPLGLKRGGATSAWQFFGGAYLLIPVFMLTQAFWAFCLIVVSLSFFFEHRGRARMETAES